MSASDVPVGAKVRFRIAGRSVVGWVLEDRGPIGVGGRHLYLVRYELGKGNAYTTEFPADQLEVIEPKKEPA